MPQKIKANKSKKQQQQQQNKIKQSILNEFRNLETGLETGFLSLY